tara:strand:+ start:629 stop:772 length:144 start_codon:yes stop_codon:yes gene_type:complete
MWCLGYTETQQVHKAKLIAPEERVAFANGEAEKVEEKVAAGAVGAAK